MISNTYMQVKAPILKLIKSLEIAGFILKRKDGSIKFMGMTHLINLSHYEIIRFYNSKINGILSYYSFATNRSKLWRIIWYLKASCGITLSRKYKMKSFAKPFKKFGSYLRDPETDTQLNIPKSLKIPSGSPRRGIPGQPPAGNKFNISKNITPDDLTKTIHIKWAGKLTQTSFGKACILCGTTNNIEMHHVRKVDDVRGLMRSGKTISLAKWRGAINRKQIPICKFHHLLYHKGELTAADIRIIRNYKN